MQHPDAPHERDAERWIGGCRRELLDRALIWNPATCGESWKATRPTTISTGHTAPCTAPRR